MTGKSYFKQGIITKLLGRNTGTPVTPVENVKSNSNDFIPSSSKKLLEIYLYFPNLNIKPKKYHTFDQCLISSTNNFDALVASQPVFFDQSLAMRYSQSMGENSGVIKAYVDDSAITASHEELYLKQGSLRPENIHGCYFNQGKIRSYLANPDFNMSILTQ